MRRSLGLPVALLLAFSIAAPAAATDPPDQVIDEGQACDFALGITFGDSGPANYREFTDKQGAVTRALLAGRGGDLTFMNMDTEATYSTAATGTVGKWFFHPDGSYDVEFMGGWIIMMFPTDIPPGPSTIQNIGRVVMSVAVDGVWTLKSMHGRQVDICAALS